MFELNWMEHVKQQQNFKICKFKILNSVVNYKLLLFDNVWLYNVIDP